MAGLFTATAASAAATTLDLSSGYATFGHNYATSTAGFTDEYLFNVDAGTQAWLAGTYTEGNSNIGGHVQTNLAVQNISWFKINDDQSRTSLAGSFGSGGFGLYAPLMAGHYGFDVLGRTLLDNRGGNYSGTLSVDVSPVPEPDAFAMAAVGLGLICFRRRPTVNPKLG
ncbi:PEP-CTERM sorting domain-containing protein [Duganella sp. LX20W]|uniref:PEP-CTERM sorting domain-containing protein n=1 Tax=Rugamonas brunnea TaxID=2758569 RepID=A0A7W2EUB8_9BURK|nr:FxDxF family PEP-CTERM protein [Rugamonas brunnea]MBA5638783.1 PEP-CTERM sorting domain-containing protein [Rugamonas brunnea]